MTIKHTQRGLSIIETLMIISLISVLLSIGIIAVNPVHHSVVGRNAQRWSDVNIIASGVYSYMVERREVASLGVTVTAREVCASEIEAPACLANGYADLSILVPAYLRGIPTDPKGSVGYGSGYAVSVSSQGQILVRSLHAEEGNAIVTNR